MIINQTASGGKSEGTNRYLVQTAAIALANEVYTSGSWMISTTRNSSNSYKIVDNIWVGNDDGGPYIAYDESNAQTYSDYEIYQKYQKNNDTSLNGKYVVYFYSRDGSKYDKAMYRQITRWGVDDHSDDTVYYLGYRTVSINITTVKYGVNDDASIYASQTKCPDGYWRING
jgi:hypothetical protein